MFNIDNNEEEDVHEIMKKKSLKLAAVALLGVITLAGCSSSKDVATMKGGKITEADLYAELKKESTTSQTLTSMILNKVIEASYGDKVDEKEITKAFEDTQEQYGGKKAFEDVLKQNNLTAKDYKASIKSSLAYQEMLKAHLDITDADLKTAWETYHPSVDVQYIVTDSEDDAKAALKAINDGTKFEEVAKKHSTDTLTNEDGGKVTFDSTTATKPENVSIPDDVKAAAYKLEDGKTSEVITSTSLTTGADSYYIVKMVKNQKKGNDYKKFEKELKEIAENTQMSDATFQQTAIGEELDKANVKISDQDFKGILDAYLPQKEETATSSTEETDSTK